ncbi:hypothetical protein GCM10010124_03960 [Pilimelia terevasa]|uniref:DUF4180 domain-containing protein n=1 Tax=Pilimelia terevasa TaxID=53372 RepID=A0A8J3BMK6_9ACTN|nr:hypothetical protein GCM10010124_03960 [Pilimelia terevasa]
MERWGTETVGVWDGAVLDGAGAAGDLVGAAFSVGVEWVVLPVARLGADFFALRTGVAGEIVQKCANYRLRLLVVGDISAHTAASGALRDFVREANRGRHVWFADTAADAVARLGGTPSRRPGGKAGAAAPGDD